MRALPIICATQVGALGASFGGYMINVINGRNTSLDNGRFKCLVNHDGIFSVGNLAYTTEELFFPEFEFGGTPFDLDPEVRQRYIDADPSRTVDEWATPTLVIHGGRDYRIVDSEGIATFTALQRRGVPSELLYFPSENHWVLSRPNSIVWHDRVLGWLARWLGGEGGGGGEGVAKL